MQIACRSSGSFEANKGDRAVHWSSRSRLIEAERTRRHVPHATTVGATRVYPATRTLSSRSGRASGWRWCVSGQRRPRSER